MPPHPPLLFVHPYRRFHLSARLRLPNQPSPTAAASSSSDPADDYYTLLLSNPAPSRAAKTRTPKSSNLSTPPSQPSTTTTTTTSSNKAPDNRILFSAPLSGPSPRMRGLARAERGLERPPEPDNCCMSGCVNCVWDAYREEVEVWAAERRRREIEEGRRGRRVGRAVGAGVSGDEEGAGMGVGDIDEVGGLRGWDAKEDEALFDGVPVGIREFMKSEKRLRERERERERVKMKEKGKQTL